MRPPKGYLLALDGDGEDPELPLTGDAPLPLTGEDEPELPLIGDAPLPLTGEDDPELPLAGEDDPEPELPLTGEDEPDDPTGTADTAVADGAEPEG